MSAQLGTIKVKMNVGGSTMKSKNDGTTLTWKFENGQFLFSLNNISPTLAAQLEENVDAIRIGIIRYQTKNAQRNNRSSTKRKTTPQSMPFGDTSTPIGIYAPTYQNMDFTDVIISFALNDVAHFRSTSKRATFRTSEILNKNWRDYGFGILINGPSINSLIFESRDVLRVYLLNQQSIPTEYSVINKKEIEVY